MAPISSVPALSSKKSLSSGQAETILMLMLIHPATLGPGKERGTRSCCMCEAMNDFALKHWKCTCALWSVG